MPKVVPTEDNENKFIQPRNVKLSLSTVLSEGNKYLRMMRLEKAITSFELVLENDPNNINALLGRSKCYIKLGKYKDAWHDSEKVLKINKKCGEASHLKGVTEYLMGNFEQGFYTYLEGCNLRTSSNQLRKGYQMCINEIENKLGADMPVLLAEEGASKLAKIFETEKDPVLKENSSFIKTCDKQGLFSSDLKFLEELSQDKNMASIHSLTDDLFNYLNARQFWEVQKSSVRNSELSSVDSPRVISRILRQLEICELALKDGNTKLCLKEGEELLKTLKSLPVEFGIEKCELEILTLYFLEQAYLMEGDLFSAIEQCKNQLNIARESYKSDLQGCTLRDMGEIYYKSKIYAEANSYFQKSLEFVTLELEKHIILYKISDCNTHLNKLGNAKTEALTCLKYARESSILQFELDIVLLLAEISIKSKEMKNAGQYFRDALEIARNIQDLRYKDIERLIQIFGTEIGNGSCSDESVRLLDISDNIRYSSSVWEMAIPSANNFISDGEINSENSVFDSQMIYSFSRQFEKCQTSLEDGDLETCLVEGKNLLETLVNVPHVNFPEKYEMEISILQVLKLAHLMEGDHSSALQKCEKQLIIARERNMSDVEGHALRCIGEIYHRNKMFRKASNCFQENMDFARSEEDKHHLLYILSDCNVHLNDLIHANVEAKECLQFAIKSEDKRFQLDIFLLLAEISVKGKEMNASKLYFRNALEIAKRIQDLRQKYIEDLLNNFEELVGEQQNDKIIKTENAFDIKNDVVEKGCGDSLSNKYTEVIHMQRNYGVTK